MLVIPLLIASHLFMTLAWYGHLRYPNAPLWKVVLISWAIAFVEYWLAVPANRFGYLGGWTAGQLKVTQEVITLLVFAGFSVLYLGESLKWNHAAAFICLIGAVAFIFADKL